MIAILIAAVLSADIDAKLISRVEKYADGFRDRLLPGGKVVRAPLKLPHAAATFLVWQPPKSAVSTTTSQGKLSRDAVRKAQREASKAAEVQFPKGDMDYVEFGKWATAFMSFKRCAFVTQFESEEDAKEFERTWLSGISRNATNLRVERNGETVIWGSGDLLEKF